MSLLILHLSDMHLHTPQDHVLKRAEAIAAALNPALPEASVLVVVFSGDIAQSGQSAEYKLAHQLLDDILKKVRREKKLPIHVIVAPGNHDCDLSGDQEARLAVVASIPRKSGAIPESYLTTATKVQKEFFAFRRKVESRDLIRFDDKLWTTYTFTVEGLKIGIDALNASWMSTNPEQQGGLIFPFERYEANSPLDFDLRLGVLHHPLNWYNQSNYLAFRSFIHRLEDVILTGHEHQTAGRLIEDAEDGQCVYVEGAALQPRSSTVSAFNILTIEPSLKQFRYDKYSLAGGQYAPIESGEWTAFRPLPKRLRPTLSLTDTFRRELQDPGATLQHPSGRDLCLDDIYVYPDFFDRTGKTEDLDARGNAKVNSSLLIDLTQLTRDVLVQGDNESGKTRLLYKLLDSYHLQGGLPLLLHGKQIKSASAQDIQRSIDAAVEYQYGVENKNTLLQATIEKKILLLDDLDLCPLNQERKGKLVFELKKRFHRLVLTVGESFEIKELIGANDFFALTTFHHYQIRPLGYVKRLELIKKWHRIGGLETQSTNDFLRVCDDAVQLIESTKLQHVASTVPIFVLSLLQATSTGISNEAHNSSFAHYYYFLVVGALDKAGVSKNDLGVYLAACTHLSWFIRIVGVEHRLSRRQFKQFVTDYSRTWTATDEGKLLDVLLRSRLMVDSGDTVQFTYAYTYYYFLGRYAAIQMEARDVQDYLRFCLQNLHVRECANTLLFLSHHTGNSLVLQHVIGAMNEHFLGIQAASLDRTDIGAIASLLASAPRLKYSGTGPDTYRQRQAEREDSADSPSDGLEDEPQESSKDLFQEMVSLSKAIEIAGTLLSHQFANYDRASKEVAIRSIFEGPLRLIRRIYTYFDDPEELIKAVSARVLSKRDDLDAERVEEAMRLAIAHLLRMFTTAFVVKAAVHLKTRDLDDNVETVVDASPTCAFRLIRIARELQRATKLPRLAIERMKKEQGDNPAVMGVLQMLVLQRLYMYETDFQDKDWAIGVFQLGTQRARVRAKSLRPPPRLER